MTQYTWSLPWADGGAAASLPTVTVNGRVFAARDQHERELAGIRHERDVARADVETWRQNAACWQEAASKAHRERDQYAAHFGVLAEDLRRVREQRDHARAGQALARRECKDLTAAAHEAALAAKDAEIAEIARLTALVGTLMTERDEAYAQRDKRSYAAAIAEGKVHDAERLVEYERGQRNKAVADLRTVCRERGEARAALAKLHEDVAMQGQRLATLPTVSDFQRVWHDITDPWERPIPPPGPPGLPPYGNRKP